MKKSSTNFVGALLMVFVGFGAIAQETEEMMPDSNAISNKMIDVNLGFNKPFQAFSPGFRSPSIGLFHFSASYRQMPNPVFGYQLKFSHDLLRDRITNANYSTNYERLSFQAVLNVTNLFHYKDWTNSIGTLIHMGPGFGLMMGTDNLGEKVRDNTAFFEAGLTPFIKMNEKVNLMLDISWTAQMFHSRTFDLNAGNPNGASTQMSASVGLSFAIGGNKNILWEDTDSGMAERLDSLEMVIMEMQSRADQTDSDVQSIEESMKDDDSDGVANYLDQEPATKEGAVVNTKGEEVIMPDVENLMGEDGQGLFYTVQLGVFSKMIPEKYWRNISPMFSLTIEDGSNRYFSGIYHSVAEAQVKLDEAKEKGIKDAFITAYYNGKRITVAEADLILSTNGPEILRKKEDQ